MTRLEVFQLFMRGMGTKMATKFTTYIPGLHGESTVLLRPYDGSVLVRNGFSCVLAWEPGDVLVTDCPADTGERRASVWLLEEIV